MVVAVARKALAEKPMLSLPLKPMSSSFGSALWRSCLRSACDGFGKSSQRSLCGCSLYAATRPVAWTGGQCAGLASHTLSRNSPLYPIQIEFAPLHLAELYLANKGKQHQKQLDHRNPVANRSASLLRDEWTPWRICGLVFSRSLRASASPISREVVKERHSNMPPSGRPKVPSKSRRHSKWHSKRKNELK